MSGKDWEVLDQEVVLDQEEVWIHKNLWIKKFGSNAIPVLGLFVPILIFTAMICFYNHVKESLTVYKKCLSEHF